MANVTTFISYAWADNDFVNEIDAFFQSIGYFFRRDVRDLKDYTFLKQFMRSINLTDRVVLMVSDNFLRSSNCMFEVLELLKDTEFKDRIAPVLLPSAKIHGRHDTKVYYDYWDTEIESLNADVIRYQTGDLFDRLKHYRNIRLNIDAFFQFIIECNIPRYEDLKKRNYRALIDYLDIKQPIDTKVLHELVSISEIANLEDRDIAMDDFILRNPENKNILYLKAYTAVQSQRYKKAFRYYSELIGRFPAEGQAHYNIATLLYKTGDFKQSKEHYLKSLELNPNSASVHYNFGCLLQDNNETEEAKSHFLRAINLNPKLWPAYFNYAVLIENENGDLDVAAQYYSDAFRLFTSNPTVEFLDKNTNEYLAQIHQRYALFLTTKHKEFEKAELYYLKAIELNPSFAAAHCNYAILLDHDLSGFDEKIDHHYKEAIRLDPENASAHFNYFVYRLSKNKDGSKETFDHYFTASVIDKKFINPGIDEIFQIDRTKLSNHNL